MPKPKTPYAESKSRVDRAIRYLKKQGVTSTLADLIAIWMADFCEGELRRKDG